MAAEKSTMRAWMHTSTNLPLDKGMTLVEDAPYPTSPLKPSEVIVKVKSVGINPADPLFAELGFPFRNLIGPHAVAGMDYSGEVVSVGSAATSLSPGDRVFGRVDTQNGLPGTMAEYVKAEYGGCVPIPAGIDWDQVAGASTAAITAYESLVLNSKPGDLVFINGGSGGVGTFAIQLAKAHGCRVVVSCSAANADLCKELGAEETIDYRTQDLVSVLKAKGRVFNLVVDYAYRPETSLYKASDGFLADGGQFVMVPNAISIATIGTIASYTLRPTFLGGGRSKFKVAAAKNNRVAFQQIAEWMDAGKVRTIVDSVFDFSDMPGAIARVKTGRSKGKVIVHV